jgi:hypothetical protein
MLFHTISIKVNQLVHFLMIVVQIKRNDSLAVSVVMSWAARTKEWDSIPRKGKIFLCFSQHLNQLRPNQSPSLRRPFFPKEIKAGA